MTRFSQGRDTSKSRLTASSSSSGMQPAGRAAGAGRDEVGALAHAPIEAVRAARIEGATGRNGVEARHGALDLHQALLPGGDARDRAHQADRIRVLRRVDHVLYRADF